MAQHPIPERLSRAIVSDLVSRIAEMGRERPEDADAAVAIIRKLPEIDTATELQIDWYSKFPPSSAQCTLDARHLVLSVSDAEGSQEIYSCYAGFYPDFDRDDLDAWLLHFRTLNAPEVAITVFPIDQGRSRDA